MKNTIKFFLASTLIFAANLYLNAQTDNLPANPEPGKCYVKCVTPDETKTVEERIMVAPGYSTLEVVPASYETVEERVLIKEGSKRFVYHPAEYETIDVTFVSKSAGETISIIPSNLTPSSQRVEVYPAHAKWEYTTYSDCASSNPLDCQVICWKEYPARFETIATQVLGSDATSKKSPIAETTSSYKKQVVKKAAWTEEIPVDAEYAVIKKQVLKTPASVKTTAVEPTYKTVTKTVLVKKGGVTSWAEIDCKLTGTNVLPLLWDYNSAVLNAEAKKVVDDALFSLMKDKENISIELSSHTDARGNDDYNLTLSQRRADAIKNYLVSKGIKSSRITSKGYGESRLKNNCSNGVDCSEDQHQVNRRTEFRIIGAN